MDKIDVEIEECDRIGTIIHVASNRKYYGHIVISDKIKKDTKKEVDKHPKEKMVATKSTKTVKLKKGEKKENIFAKIARYFRGVGKETKRIKWTSGKDLVKYSVAAVAFVIFFGIYFYGIDWIVLLIRKLAN